MNNWSSDCIASIVVSEKVTGETGLGSEITSQVGPTVDSELNGHETNRTRRISCSKEGCHKGHCYAYCDLGLCYTTRGSSQSHQYVRCSSVESVVDSSR